MIAVLSIAATVQTVHAEDTDIIKYKINNQEARTVTANGLNATNDTILIIPETTVIDGTEYTVTDISIGKLGNEARYIQRVIVPKTVTRITRLGIRNSATKMFKVEFAENSTLRVIGDNACSTSQLIEFEIPSTVDSIGSYAFGGASLQRVEIPKGVKKINSSTFSRSAIREIVMHDSIKSIGNSAFQDCKNLQAITIPSTTDTIGKSAFKGCTMLSNVTLPAELKYIDSEAFAGCDSLREITLPEKLTDIGNSAFQDCKNLQTITIPSTTKIGNSAFKWCTMLSSVTLPVGLKYLGDNAFSECVSLRKIALPDGLTTINAYTFDGCAKLSNVTLPAELKTIDSYAFLGCDSLKHITLPASVDSIGKKALQNVTDVYPTGAIPARIGSNAFADNAEIHVDMSQIDAYAGASGWKDYDVHGDEFSVGYLSYIPTSTRSAYVTGNSLPENGKLTVPKTVEHEGYSLDVTAITDHALPELASEITIDAQVETIGFQTFYNYNLRTISNLTKIVLPQTLKRIEARTFAFTDKLKSIELPAGLERIEDCAFFGSGISDISLKETNIQYIGSGAFSGCPIEEISLPQIYEIPIDAFSNMPKLQNIYATSTGDGMFDIDGVLYRRINGSLRLYTYPAGRTAESYTVADGTQYIYGYAFCGITALKHVTLPEGLEYISGFKDSGLTEISLPSTVLRIGDNAFARTNLRTLRLPENLEMIYSNSLFGCPINVIFAEPITPPRIYPSNYLSGHNNLYVCVKPENIETYKGQNWGNLDNFTTEIYDDGTFLYAPLTDSKAIVIGTDKALSGDISIPEEVSTGNSNSKRTVTEIASNAFMHPSLTYFEDTITSLTIPQTIETIKSNAIENYAIKEIKLNDKQSMTFETNALSYVYGLKSFRIPDNAKMEFPNLSGCSHLTEVIAGENNMYHTSQDGVLYSKNMDTLQICPISRPSRTYIMPLSVKAIAPGALEFFADSMSIYMLHKDELPILLGNYYYIYNTTLYVRENSTFPSDGNAMWEEFFKNIVRLTDEEADGILTSVSEVNTDINPPYTDGAYYTPAGVRVTKPSKGLYIHNGRKVIVK